MKQLRLGEIARSIGAVPQQSEHGARVIRRVATDSRQVAPGDLFWALRGQRFDGHDFVKQAFEAGAVAAVVDAQQKRDYGDQCAIVKTNDTTASLGRFAQWYRRGLNATVVAVTGSVGKSSTRDAIWSVLATKWSGVRSPASFNNQIGVPLSLFLAEPRHDFAVIELGAGSSGEIRGLAQIAAPQVGVLTAVAPAHLEGFGSVDCVARTKGELLEVLGPNGTAILNRDDPHIVEQASLAPCKKMWFGVTRQQDSDVAADDVHADGQTVTFRLDSRTKVTLRAAGKHQVYAALAAAAVGKLWGMNQNDIVAGLERYESPPMRCEVSQTGGGVTIINDAYNANPASMTAALELIRGWSPARRRMLVLGDMAELGRQARKYHQELGKDIARREGIDYVITLGPLSREVVRAAQAEGTTAQMLHAESPDEVCLWLQSELKSGDVVLFKGSRAARLEEIVARIREELKSNAA